MLLLQIPLQHNSFIYKRITQQDYLYLTNSSIEFIEALFNSFIDGKRSNSSTESMKFKLHLSYFLLYTRLKCLVYRSLPSLTRRVTIHLN